MKIEKLETSNNKFKYIAIGFILAILIVILINYLTSRANYRNTQSIDLAKGTINYKVPDLNVLAMFIDGEPTDTMPGAGYEIDESQSYCYTTNSQVHEEDITLLLNRNGNLEIGNLKKGSKCYLYFVEAKSPSEQMVAKLEKSKGSKYTINAMPEITDIEREDKSGQLFTAEDNYGISYVFRGKVDDNWVQFANFYWRIIRVNGDGTIRLIYNGIKAGANGTNAQINNDSAFNTDYLDNTYVGYYYGSPGSNNYALTHSNSSPSSIARNLESWYNNNLSDYTSKISGSTGFCNDRQVNNTDNEEWQSGDTKLGYGTGTTIYAPTGRLKPFGTFSGIQKPSLKCGLNPSTKQVDNNALERDLFTTRTDVGKGNGRLINPIGLITSDEVVLAGGFAARSNDNLWLRTNSNYWTMSPTGTNDSQQANVFYITYNGTLDGRIVYVEFGVRPVINLKADIEITGKGTATEPFIVS